MLVSHIAGLVQFEIDDDSPLALELTRERLVADAEAAHAQYPQYAGHWDDFRLARVTRRIRTKMGVAFEPGDVVLAKHDPDLRRIEALGGVFHTAYSFRNKIDTAVDPSHLTYL